MKRRKLAKLPPQEFTDAQLIGGPLDGEVLKVRTGDVRVVIPYHLMTQWDCVEYHRVTDDRYEYRYEVAK